MSADKSKPKGTGNDVSNSPFAIKTQRAAVTPPPELVRLTTPVPPATPAPIASEQTIPPTQPQPAAGAGLKRTMVPPPDAQGRPRWLDTPVQGMSAPAPVAPAPAVAPAVVESNPPVPKKSGGGAGLIGGVVAAVVLLGGGAGYFLMKDGGAETKLAAEVAPVAAPQVARAPEPAVAAAADAGDELEAAMEAKREAEALMAQAREGMAPGEVDPGLAVAFAGASAAQRRFEAGELREARELWQAAARSAGEVAVKGARRRYEAAFGAVPAKMLTDYAPDEAAKLSGQVRAAEGLAVRDPKAAVEAYDQAVAGVKSVREAAARQTKVLAEKAVAAKDAGMALYFYEQELRLAPGSEAAQAYLFRHKFQPGQRLTTPTGLTLAYVPPGSFKQGTPTGEPGRDADEVQRTVTLTKGFYLGTTEVTQAMWDQVMGAGQAEARITAAKQTRDFIGGNKPMVLVTWEDAQEFCRRLGEREKARYRLPTEAEWEYACRAGTVTAFQTGAGLSLRDANIDDGSDRVTGAPVAAGTTGVENAWGLSDLHGNVWEWCADWSAPYAAGAVADPAGPSDAQVGRPDLAMKVVRGGSWNDGATEARSGNRWSYSPVVVTNYIGFRVIREIDFSSQP
jgi:formylglycine-generating enzyme required for sulfatase activity